MLFYLILFIFWNVRVQCIQPYFPPQITFTVDDSNLYAIDEINQQAYRWNLLETHNQFYAYAMQHFPFTTPDSPQSKNYVQLELFESPYCVYNTIWEYGAGFHDSFPQHWYYNTTSFHIGNYMIFNSTMIHSTNSSQDEDYWYSEKKCSVDSGDEYPCEEIFFKKNTDIPLRTTYVYKTSVFSERITINYKVISVGKPDEKLFDRIPKNWLNNCTDLNLGLDFILPSSSIIQLNETVTVEIRLTSPPHRVEGNDTMNLQWQIDQISSICKDCLTWEPKQLHFDINNFHQYQTINVTRIKDGSQTMMRPIMNGGGYEKTRTDLYRLFFR